MDIKIHTTDGCFYCDQMKELCKRADLDYESIEISSDELSALYPKAMSYPYVIIDGVEYPGLVPTAKFLVENGLIKSGQPMTDEQRAEFNRKHYFSEGQCVD